jgi:hypothetical protein
MKSQIKIKILFQKFIECQDDDCWNKRECTNHSSAGDFRCDWGDIPNITGYDAASEVAWCSTKTTMQQPESGSYLKLGEIPQQLSMF